VKKTLSPDLPLRGNRNYIHGTDIYEAILAALESYAPCPAPISFSLSIHHFSRHAIDLTITDEPVTNFPDIAAVAFRTSAGLNGWMIESDRPVTRTVPFREADITEKAEVAGNVARIAGHVAYPPIDVLVILTKFWHLQRLPDAGKAWVFVKLELSRLLQTDDSDRLSIQVDQNLANRLTRAIVAVGGQAIGHIYFSKIDVD
jgi:hypothetical protein